MGLYQRIAVALTVLILTTASGQAGVYSTDEPLPFPGASFAVFQRSLDLYLSVAPVPGFPDSPQRQYYLSRVKELEAKGDRLTTDDRVNLSAYYIRLGEVAATAESASHFFGEAIKVLEPVNDRQQPHFMVLANLGTAHHLTGQLDRAAAYIEQALAVWPTIWPGMNRAQLAWYRRAEKVYLTLLKSRLEESRLPGRAPETVDPLFPRVRFVGPGGRYTAGEINLNQPGELPDDAQLIVGQLLLWMPNDSRLYWLLGEVLNAKGEIFAASDIFNALVQRGYSFREIQEHRQVVNAARESARAVLVELTPLAREQLSGVFWPRGAMMVPGVGAVANEVGWITRVQAMSQVPRPPEIEDSNPPDSNGATPAPVSPWMPDVKHIVVSFLAGVVVTLLGALQFRELRRKAAVSREDASSSNG